MGKKDKMSRSTNRTSKKIEGKLNEKKGNEILDRKMGGKQEFAQKVRRMWTFKTLN